MFSLKSIFVAFLIGGLLLTILLLIGLLKKKVTFKRSFFVMFGYCIVAILVFYPYRSRILSYYHRFQKEIELRDKSEANCACALMDLPKDDYARKHRPLAIRFTKNGFIKDEATLNVFLAKKRLVEVDDADGYFIQHLASSSKHLTPVAKRRLIELGLLYRSFLKNTPNENDYFVISSMTRTEIQQEEICRKYPRTCTRGKSTHSFGVSFDISRIKSFGDCSSSRQALIKALNQLRDEKKILVCPESTCTHITVIN
jgi:hypothetical protein